LFIFLVTQSVFLQFAAPRRLSQPQSHLSQQLHLLKSSLQSWQTILLKGGPGPEGDFGFSTG
jgi:hypothetical protein